MGLFDDLAKLADKGIKAVENGALEKSLAGGLDKLEGGLDKAIKSAETAAAAPEKVLKTVEARQEQVTKVVHDVKQQATRTIDVLQQ